MDNLVVEIVEAPNSQLSSEEKSMLVNALLDDLETNQLSTTSSTADNAQVRSLYLVMIFRFKHRTTNSF